MRISAPKRRRGLEDPGFRGKAAAAVIAVLSLAVLVYSCSLRDRGGRAASPAVTFAQRGDNAPAPPAAAGAAAPKPRPSPDLGAPIVDPPAPPTPAALPTRVESKASAAPRAAPAASPPRQLRASIAELSKRRTQAQRAAERVQAAARALRSPAGLDPALAVGVTRLGAALDEDAPGMSAPLPALRDVERRLAESIACLSRLSTGDDAQARACLERSAGADRFAAIRIKLEKPRRDTNSQLNALIEAAIVRGDKGQQTTLREIAASVDADLAAAEKILD